MSQPAGSSYGRQRATKKGEVVKSEGEKRLADYFFDNNINYLYENKASTSRSAFPNQISKPDFYLPDYKVYVEYWGMIDVADPVVRAKYERNMKWKMKQYYDNGVKFISIYPQSLRNLDTSFRAQFKKTMLQDFVPTAVGGNVVFALRLSPNFRQFLNNRLFPGMTIANMHLVYEPYYFVNYDCFSQGYFFYERVNLSSKGMVVLTGNGEVADFHLGMGASPSIRATGVFADCVNLEQQEMRLDQVAPGVKFERFEAAPAKISTGSAGTTTKTEIARNLAQTFERTNKDGSTSTKTIRPSVNDVRIKSIKLAHVPIVTAFVSYRDRYYQRILQAATCKFIIDDLFYCNAGQKHYAQAIQLCTQCGNLTCSQHGKTCEACHAQFCSSHMTAKGLVLKKYYCPAHVPMAPAS